MKALKSSPKLDTTDNNNNKTNNISLVAPFGGLVFLALVLVAATSFYHESSNHAFVCRLRGTTTTTTTTTTTITNVDGGDATAVIVPPGSEGAQKLVIFRVICHTDTPPKEDDYKEEFTKCLFDSFQGSASMAGSSLDVIESEYLTASTVYKMMADVSCMKDVPITRRRLQEEEQQQQRRRQQTLYSAASFLDADGEPVTPEQFSKSVSTGLYGCLATQLYEGIQVPMECHGNKIHEEYFFY